MYKGKKRTAFCFLAVLLCVCTVFAAGCHKKPNTPPDGGNEEPPAVLTPAISETAIELHIGEEFALTV